METNLFYCSDGGDEVCDLRLAIQRRLKVAPVQEMHQNEILRLDGDDIPQTFGESGLVLFESFVRSGGLDALALLPVRLESLFELL